MMPPGHIDRTKPLKPLSAHAKSILRQLYMGPLAAYLINPGVRDRLIRGGLAEQRGHTPSRSFLAYRITEAGREFVRQLRDT